MRFVTCVLGLLLLAGAAPAQQYPIRIRTGPGVESNTAMTASKAGYVVLPDGGRLVPSSAPATEAATQAGELWLSDDTPASNGFSLGVTNALHIFHSESAMWRPIYESSDGNVVTKGSLISLGKSAVGTDAVEGPSFVVVHPTASTFRVRTSGGATPNAWDMGDSGNSTWKLSEISTGAVELRVTKDGGLTIKAVASPPTTNVTMGMLHNDTSGALCWRGSSSWIKVAGPGECNGSTQFLLDGWVGYGTTQQSVSLGPGAATLDATKSYVVIAADAGTNTLTTATCTGCIEGDEVEFHKSGANGLNFSASGTGANQFARACDMSAADSTSRWRRAEGGYWRLLSCVP